MNMDFESSQQDGTTLLLPISNRWVSRLDVSSRSTSECAGAVAEKTGGCLDILINNSGAIYSIPLTDADIDMGRKLFDLNV
jgi:1-acylglycerone phosphate reductase